jgi:hypothetical protein
LRVGAIKYFVNARNLHHLPAPTFRPFGAIGSQQSLKLGHAITHNSQEQPALQALEPQCKPNFQVQVARRI